MKLLDNTCRYSYFQRPAIFYAGSWIEVTRPYIIFSHSMGPDQNLVGKLGPIKTVRQNWQLKFTLIHVAVVLKMD